MVANSSTKSPPDPAGNPLDAPETETVGQVTGGIAHDLNNVLGIIICNLGLLQELCGDRTDIEEFARDAMAAALQGSSLVQQLFAFAQRRTLLDTPSSPP